MSFPPTPYHADSDADDEYERSVVASPRLPPDSDISPSDSEPPSVEHTPTTYGHSGEDRSSPRTIITEWTSEECADFLGGLGLHTYCDTFLENDIVGEALVALKHDELKEMGVSSVGHRLTILKSVYETKVKQDIPLDPDHYVPLSVEQSMLNEPVTQGDFSRITQGIRLRDERIISAEAELRKLADDYRRLREELLPVFKMAKDRSQPLPYQPPNGGSNNDPNYHNHDPIVTSPVTTQPEKLGSSLSRTFSKKLFLGGTTPKNNSPTHIPQSIPEGRAYNDTSTLDPSAAAMAASSHLTASMNGGSQPSPKNPGSMPSPTSPANFYPQPTLGSRSYSREGTSTTTSSRTLFDHPEDPQSQSRTDRSNPSQPPQSSRQEPPNSGSRNPNSQNSSSTPNPDPTAPSVEIFKTFRVSMDDPCHKVLPAALKKYQINADWRQYALYIVYGDQERCLGLEERPLILFKQLDKEGRKPMFMLRKHTQPVEGHTSSVYPSGGGGPGGGPPGSAHTDGSGGNPGSAGARGGVNQSAIHLPGGVL